MSESVQEVTDKDIDVFYHPDAQSTSQAQASANMGFEEKTPNLLALLIAYTRGSSPAVAVPPCP